MYVPSHHIPSSEEPQEQCTPVFQQLILVVNEEPMTAKVHKIKMRRITDRLSMIQIQLREATVTSRASLPIWHASSELQRTTFE
jgi:hypothetical protein